MALLCKSHLVESGSKSEGCFFAAQWTAFTCGNACFGESPPMRSALLSMPARQNSAINRKRCRHTLTDEYADYPTSTELRRVRQLTREHLRVPRSVDLKRVARCRRKCDPETLTAG